MFGSVPVALGVSAERVSELGITLAAPDGAFGEIDAAPEIGEARGARDGVDGGGNACQPECQVERDREAIVGEDQRPERREILEPRSSEEAD